MLVTLEISPTYHFLEVCSREKGEWQARVELSNFCFIRRAGELWVVNAGREEDERKELRCLLNICISVFVDEKIFAVASAKQRLLSRKEKEIVLFLFFASLFLFCSVSSFRFSGV